MNLDLLKAILPFAGAALGAVCGAFFKAWFDSRQEQRRLRFEQLQRQWLPLLQSGRALRLRLHDLTCVFHRTSEKLPFTPESLTGDFRELYFLNRDESDLENADPNMLRGNPIVVQKLRTRMAHHLNYAASSLYLTAAYLGRAELVSRSLQDRSLVLAETSRADLSKMLWAIRDALQGPSGAGIAWEEQESVAEMMWTAEQSVISYFEFRRKLLDMPGWEQFMGLFRFFVGFGPKVDYEVAATIQRLNELNEGLTKICSW